MLDGLSKSIQAKLKAALRGGGAAQHTGRRPHPTRAAAGG
jgi:hypothetical protein